MASSSLIKYVAAAAAGATIFGFSQALPNLGGLPSQIALFSAARGLATAKELAGYNATSPADSFNGWLWNAGGPTLLAAGQWFSIFLQWSVATFLVLLLITWVISRLGDSRTRRMLYGFTATVLLLGCVPALRTTLNGRGQSISDLKLIAPLELIDRVRSFDQKDVFSSATGQAQLLLFSPDSAGGVSPEEALAQSRNPTKWREELRKNKWKAALLAGPVTEYRPLLEHLIASPDWHLAAFNNQGYLFLRGPGQPAPAINAETFVLATPLETAVYLAQMTERLDAIGRSAEARDCIERANQLAPNNATVLAHAATYAAAHKRWQDAVSFSERALAIEPDFAQARIVQALALLEMGDPARAQRLIDGVLAHNPNDLYTLFLAARIHRARNDHAGEAEVLEKTIEISTEAGLPVVNYRIYLGQAYARLGRAAQALENYRAVLSEARLNPEQTTEIQDAIKAIEAKESR